jgi:hypothetical protein
MGKTSLLYFCGGFLLGGLLLIAEASGATWGSAYSVVHAHILFVGWFVQFAIGIAYWLLPRRKTPEKPLGYNTSLAYVAYSLANVGMVIRIILEPLYLTGFLQGTLVTIGLSISGIMQVGAGIIWTGQLWGRFFLRYSASNQPVSKAKK